VRRGADESPPAGPRRSAPSDHASAARAAAVDAGAPRNSWIAPGSKPGQLAPQHPAGCWKAGRGGSWDRLPERPRGAVLQTSDLLAQQFIVDADGGDDRFQAPLLLVFDIGFAAL